MPIENGYAYGDETPAKCASFKAIFNFHVDVTERILSKPSNGFYSPRYHYFDITAGPGANDSLSCELPPVIAAKKLSGIRREYLAAFIEREPKHFNQLCTALSGLARDGGEIRLYNEDHMQLLPTCCIPGSVHPRNYLGLIYFDPTPCRDQEDSLRAIGALVAKYQRLEVLLYLSATAAKRMLSLGAPRFFELLKLTGKQHWLIREPASAFQWTYALGSDWRGFAKTWRSQGFYPTDDLHGADILRRLSLTRNELQEAV